MAEYDELVKRLYHLVALNEPRHGGPYAGSAAEACVASMREAATAIEALQIERDRAWEILESLGGIVRAEDKDRPQP